MCKTCREINSARKNDPYDWQTLEIRLRYLLIQAEKAKLTTVYAPINTFPKFTAHNNVDFVLGQLNDCRLANIAASSPSILGRWMATDGHHLDYVIFLKLPESRLVVDAFDPETLSLVRGRTVDYTTLCLPRDFAAYGLNFK